MFLDIIAAHADKVDGVKVSLLDAGREIALRRRLPGGRAALHRRRLQLPGADRRRRARAQRRAARRLRRDRPRRRAPRCRRSTTATARPTSAILEPTVPLARKLFEAPTFNYKTGIVFLAFLNGHQDHFRMVGGLRERAVDRAPRGPVRARRPRRACCATRRSPSRACGTCSRSRGSRDRPARLSLNLITVDHWSLAEAVDALRRGRASAGSAPWRHQYADAGARRARTIRDGRAARSRACAAAASSPPPGARRGQPPRRRGGGRARRAGARARLRRRRGDRDLRAARADDRRRDRARCCRTRPSTASGSASSRCTR